MGLIMKKAESEEHEYIAGLEVVGRGEGPKGDDEVEHVEIHECLTAEDISGKTAAAEAERELEADPELLDADAEDAGAADAGEADGVSEPEGVEDSEPAADASADSSPAAPAVTPRAARPKKTRMQRAMMGKHKYFIAGALPFLPRASSTRRSQPGSSRGPRTRSVPVRPSRASTVLTA